MARKCAYCGNPIPSGEWKKQKYCSNAHKQAAYRARKQKKIEAYLQSEKQMLSLETYNRARRLIKCFGEEMLDVLGKYKAIHGTLATDHAIDFVIATLDHMVVCSIAWEMTDVNPS